MIQTTDLDKFQNLNDVAVPLFPAETSFGRPPETRTLGPLIKSQGQSGPEPNIDKKAQLFRGLLAFSSTTEGVCSAQVQTQNKHSRGLKALGSALTVRHSHAQAGEVL